MTVKELYDLAETPIEVKSGYNGKVLCKAYNEEKNPRISDRKILSIWAEIRANNPGGYSSIAKPVICVYVYGDEEYAQDEERRHRNG